jgi:anti-anti-sigma factor
MQTVAGTAFSIAVRPERSRVVVTPEGELDIATAAPLEQEVHGLCARGFTDICLDLSRLDFFDSSGLRLLLRLDGSLAERDCRLTLVVGDGAAARVLRLTHLEDRFARADR